MSTGNKGNFKNYAFITGPEHVCHELIKLTSITFQDMLLIIQEVKRSNTSFKERKNITKSSLRRNVKSAADNV